jgi:molybdopterin adenylyltransferase
MNENTGIKIVSVNISEKKGTGKAPVEYIDLEKTGITGDAHAGAWHRQVSLLAVESLQRFARIAGREIGYGEFAENITTSGLELAGTNPLDLLVAENAELEITQIGKKCHGSSCAILKEAGDCVMPKEGVFARVIRGGRLRAGDSLVYRPRKFRFLVLTLSDRASSGEYEDRSGPAIRQLLKEHFSKKNRGINIEHHVIPDDEKRLRGILEKSLMDDFDFIITTGGTGIGSRDITPDVVRPMLDKEIPGIMEMIRVKYGGEKPRALLSRGVAGLAGSAFIYTLPGSVRAVNEYMQEILKTMEHLAYMLYGLDNH